MDTPSTTVKAACTFGACGQPATVTVSIAYPASVGFPELDIPAHAAFTWDGGGRCDEHLQAEHDLAGYVDATVTSTPVSQGVGA